MHEELRAGTSEHHRPGAGDRRDAGQQECAQSRLSEGCQSRISPGSGARHIVLAALAVALAIALSMGAAAVVRAAGDKAYGQYLSSECVTCHQLSGRFEGIPPIVGWPEQSFVEIMKQYRNKERANPVMQTIAGKLSEEEIAALAAYFGSLTPTPQGKRNSPKSP